MSLVEVIGPNSGAPARIASEIAAALRAVPAVRAIALFGSLADGRADAWSDVDMLVACDDVEATQWAAAAALRRARQVLFYRPFTRGQQPSGRYWLVGESPFHKVDISFDPVEEYESLLNGGGRLGHEITTREVYRRPGSGMFSAEAVQSCPLTIGEREREIGSYICLSLLSLKRCFRGGEDTRAFEDLLAAAEELPRSAVAAGGMIGELVHTVAALLPRVPSGA